MPSERKYAERLREQAYKTLSPQIKNLEEELNELKESLSNGVYRLERKLEAVGRIELPTTEVVLDEIMDEVLRQKSERERSLAEFARDLRGKETQEEILGVLLDAARQFSPKVALFSVRKDRLEGWSSRGYDEESAHKLAEASLPRSEHPQLEKALEGEEIVETSDLSGGDALAFLQPQTTAGQFLAPLHVLQRPVALLYAGPSEEETVDKDALAILIELTVLRIENTALKILYALSEDKTEAPAPPEAPETTAPPEPPEPPEPEPMPEPVPEPVPEVEESSFETDLMEEEAPVITPAFEPEPVRAASPPPIPTSRPGISEDPQIIMDPALQTSQSKFEAQEIPSENGQEIPAEEPETPDAGEIPPQQQAMSKEEEENLHADAKRFARLLVSEIKLYNENQVAEGRKNQDLYLRLKRDIDKSREMYEKRISHVVSQKVDYFHDEIVRILGENDPSTLGSDYPGPRNPE
jgi:hypothetical protein